MKEAVKPNFYTEITSLPSLREIEEREVDTLDLDSQALVGLSTHKGWRVLQKKMDDISEQLDGMVKGAMESGATFEQIGQKTVVVDLAKYVLKRVRESVTDAVEAAERIERQQSGKN